VSANQPVEDGRPHRAVAPQQEQTLTQGKQEQKFMSDMQKNYNSMPPANPFNSTKKRDVSIDILKILAIFWVVVIHSNDKLFDVAGQDLHLWWIAYIYLACCLSCVSLFVLCSGALILSSSKEEAPLDFYMKRLPRLFIPLAAWSVVYYIYKIGDAPLTVADIPRFIHDFISGKILPQLWFMYMMIGVYLSAPFLRMLIRQATRSQMWMFTFLCLVVAPPHPLLQRFLGLSVGITYQIFSTFIGLFVLGYLLQTVKATRPRGRLGLLMLYILLVLGSLFGNWFIRTHDAQPQPLFQNFDVITVSIMAAVVFVLVRSLPLDRLAPWSRTIAAMSNASYGIYLVHILMRYLLKHGVLGFTVTPLLFPPALGVLLTAVAIFVLSLLFVLILKQIPYLRQTVGYGKAS
jgi:surface polysaccharide O-acyltransferase-like enzyme